MIFRVQDGLVFRVGRLRCIVPIAAVIETLRPLPIEPLARPDTPFVRGAAIVRGAPVPVVDVARLLQVAGDVAARFVLVRTADGRRVALLVDEVIGLGAIDASAAVPPLLRDVAASTVAHLGALDAQLAAVLDATRLVEVAA